MARIALLTATLAMSAACLADAEAVGSDATAASGPVAPARDAMVIPPAVDAGHPTARRHPPAPRRTVAQSIDERVRRLTRGLELDPDQQEKLRQILMDQHRAVMALRSGNAGVPVDVAGTSLAIYDQTRVRIRAMLNDEQKQKYSAEVPRGELAPAQADLLHWMDLQDEKRRQGKGEDESK